MIRFVCVTLCLWPCCVLAEEKPVAMGEVSYFKQIRPLFQTHCQGCHQPAKQGGNYVMTAHDTMLRGGES